MLSIDDFLQLARSRRTIRSFQADREVPEEYIEKILEAARWAPSGGNGQPWEFIVIRDPARRKRIVELFLKARGVNQEMERAMRPWVSPPREPGFQDAPVFILVLGDPRVNECYPISSQGERAQENYITGLANATLMMHLAAASLGLASQYVTTSRGTYMSTLLKAELGIPDYMTVYELIPIGYPARRPEPPPRRPLEEIVHREGYEPAKARNAEALDDFLWSQTRLGDYGRRRRPNPPVGRAAG